MFALLGRSRRHWPVAVALLLVCGCGEGDGVGKRVPVEGSVLVDGKPLRGMTGAVTFIPDKATGNESPFQAAGAIDQEGRYSLSTKGKPGAPPGRYKVVVSAVPPGAQRDDSKLAVHPRYVVERNTPLKMEVVTDPSPGHYDLKLTRR